MEPENDQRFRKMFTFITLMGCRMVAEMGNGMVQWEA